MTRILQDLQYAFRQFAKNPGFTLTAVLSLALGIGATAAVFSVIYAALLDPYPFRAADRIMRLSVRNKTGNVDMIGLNPDQIRQLQRVDAVESVLAMDYRAMTMTGSEFPENVNLIGLISGGFQDLGVAPLMGRGLIPSDSVDGREPEPVAVISHQFWMEHLGGDPQIVGKTLALDRKSFTIVGVAAPRFRWYSADVYIPLHMDHDPQHFCMVNFRLKPGVTARAADSALQPLLDQFAKDMPKRFPEHFQMAVEGLNEWVNRSMSGTLYLLFGAVGLLLAVGCANVSILLMAQGTARQQEFAVRAAVGASGRDLIRQLITESLLLATIGLAAGVMASYLILAAIKAVLPTRAFAPEVVIHINIPVLIFSSFVAAGTALLFGLWPALQMSWTHTGQAMAGASKRVAGSIWGQRTHRALIGLQIALTLVLLATAGSAMKAFVELSRTPLGYDPHHVMSVGIPLRTNSYTTWAARADHFERLRAKVAETPGVTIAAISSNATPPRSGNWSPFEILGMPAAESQKASMHFVSPEYFAALRIPVREGRLWSEIENHNGAQIVVVNQTLAQRYFSSVKGGAIGRSVKIAGLDPGAPRVLTPPKIAESWLQIVGIVSDVRNDGLSSPIAPAVYLPFSLQMWPGTQILVKSEAPPLTLLRAVRKQLTAVDPQQQSYSSTEVLEAWISNQDEWQQNHLAAWVFGVFGAFGLALAAVGLFSVVSYTVAQRTNEFAVRMALGAEPGHVLRIVFTSVLGSVGLGVAIGLVLTRGVSPLLARWAKGNSGDPVILLAGALVLGVVSALACAIPAWRASRVDPMRALRCE